MVCRSSIRWQVRRRGHADLVPLMQSKGGSRNRRFEAASFVSSIFSAFPSWRTRHSASLPMIS
jgi:hypothetical protein